MRFRVLPRALTCALFLSTTLPTIAAPPAWMLEVKPSRRIQATMTTEVETPAAHVHEWIAFASAAPDLPSQSPVTSRMNPAARTLSEAGPGGRSVLMARVGIGPDATTSSLSISVHYEATLYARRLVQRDAKTVALAVTPLSAAARKIALAQTATINFNASAVRDWLRDSSLIRDEKEGEVDFARRVYHHLQKTCGYEYHKDLDRRASSVCRSGKSDCAGLSALFVAALRANEVPARMLVGHMAQSMVPGRERETSCHVRAEFHAEGVGWVPVDAACGLATKNDRHFGNDDGDHFVQHLDMDLMLDPKLFPRKEISMLQTSYFWFTGGGTSDRMRAREGWKVKPLPLQDGRLAEKK